MSSTADIRPASPRFHKRLDTFLRGAAALDVSEQLTTMQQFWRLVGLQMPVPTPVQIEALTSHIKTRGHERVVPTPFLTPKARVAITGRVAQLVPVVADELGQPALGEPNPTVNPLGAMAVGSEAAIAKRHELRYATPGSPNLHRRADYIHTMVRRNLAVPESSQRIMWLFPFMDSMAPRQYTNAQQTNKYTGQRPKDLDMLIDPAVTPDSLLTIALLNTLHRYKPLAPEISFGNEHVFSIGTHTVVSTVGIQHQAESPIVAMVTSPLDRVAAEFGARRATNGLVPRPASRR